MRDKRLGHSIFDVPQYRDALDQLKKRGISQKEIESAGKGRFSIDDLENFAGRRNGKKRMTKALRGIFETIDEVYGGPIAISEYATNIASNDFTGFFDAVAKEGCARTLTVHVDMRGLYGGVIWTGRRWQIAFLEIISVKELVHWRCYRIDEATPAVDASNLESDAGIVLAAGADLVFLGREVPVPERTIRINGVQMDTFRSLSVWNVNVESGLGGAVTVKGFRYAGDAGGANTATPVYFRILERSRGVAKGWEFGPARYQDWNYGFNSSALGAMCYRGLNDGRDVRELVGFLAEGCFGRIVVGDAMKFLGQWELAQPEQSPIVVEAKATKKKKTMGASQKGTKAKL